MKGKLGDQVRIQHILEAISEVAQYLKNVSYEQFLENSEKRYATIKQIEIIGEACNAISEELKSVYPNVLWRQIIAFRNFSVHEYFGINNQIVWEIATTDLPALQMQIIAIFKAISQ